MTKFLHKHIVSVPHEFQPRIWGNSLFSFGCLILKNQNVGGLFLNLFDAGRLLKSSRSSSLDAPILTAPP
jgi:hypothetical protein